MGKWILKNLILALVYIAVLIAGVTIGLAFFTNHNKEIEVPDFTTLSVKDAAQLAESVGIRVEVTDSVYVRRMERGAVFSQNPAAGSRVKKNRLIRLTTNAVNAKQVSMPNLVGYSMRQAKAELSSKGLNLGKLIYVSDMATNNVLKQQYRGKDIRTGTMIDSGSEVDLVVGLSDTDNQTRIPNVVGMKYNRAVDAVHDNSLNVARTTFDDSVKNYNDSLNAVVFRQSPSASSAPIGMGGEVSLFFTLDESKLPQ
ncbi:MAG: PASTA domain-containing protein [Bacteroidales bacterium]|nr:PASTA domain-containing protein [Bacteroidales bacterium]MBP5537655.1 PASTA domain-containing protein [Bacteroidales bacterium]